MNWGGALRGLSLFLGRPGLSVNAGVQRFVADDPAARGDGVAVAAGEAGRAVDCAAFGRRQCCGDPGGLDPGQPRGGMAVIPLRPRRDAIGAHPGFGDIEVNFQIRRLPQMFSISTVNQASSPLRK